MPELPEAERARRVLEEHAVGRTIAAADDRDTYVCRPHPPGEIDGVLRGLTVTAAKRRGKTLWLETDGGIDLGLHLGMSGSMRVNAEPSPRGWDRFALELTDGTRIALHDKRRLGRARLDAERKTVGPDAATVSRDEFRRRLGRRRIPVKAALLNQSVVAGVGNLLADEALWLARLDPRTPANELTEEELDRLRVQVRRVIREALRDGEHTGTGRFVRARKRGVCPRCGGPLGRDTVGGRTTIWCVREQERGAAAVSARAGTP